MRSRKHQALRLLVLWALGLSLLACAPTQQERYKASLTPISLVVPRPAITNKPRLLRVRVYADRQHRTESMNWEKKLKLLFTRANHVLTPAYGVTLQVVSTEDWDRNDSSSSMKTMISELAILDAGDDADWVIGLVTQLPRESADMHVLGSAFSLSKHIIIRGTNDLAELKSFRKDFDQLTEAEIEELYFKRVKHKQLLVLLHELGHTLGAFHTDVASIMRPVYTAKISWFAPYNDEIVAQGLRYRGAEPEETGDYRRHFIETLKRLNQEGFDVSGPAKEVGVNFGDAEPARRIGASSGGSGATNPVIDEPPAAVAEALAKARAGKRDEANALLAALSPHDAQSLPALHLRCQLATAGAAEACQAANKLGFGSAETSWELAKAYRRSKMPEFEAKAMEAARLALRTETLLSKQLRLHLARRSMALAQFTALEDFLAPLEDDELITRLKYAATRERRLFGIHQKAVSAADEAQAYRLVKQALALVQTRDFEAAKKAVAVGRKRFPNVGGFAAVLCDLEIRRQRFAPAQAHCAKAIQLDPNATWARYLAGAIADHRGHAKEAIALLERAVELDTSIVGAWKLLTKLLRQTGRESEIQALRARYLSTFGSAASF